jgi:hypothetical protein
MTAVRPRPLVRTRSREGTRPPGPTRRQNGESLRAAQVLAVMVLALGLAALVNADALVERAERKPIGAGRDRSLALWHPVQDISHVLQLHRLRLLADDVAGDDNDATSPVGSATASDPSTPTTVPTRPELRQATAADPLRVWVGGDSIVRDYGESFLRLAGDVPTVEAVLHYEISSGLTRPDYLDWPASLAADLEEHDPEAAVIMFGANDAQGLVASDGTTFERVEEPGWQAEYTRRVASIMDQLQGRLVFWVLQPPMREGTFDARMRILNDIYRAQAAGRPWIEIVETAPLFGDANGRYVELRELPGGGLEDLRQDDGIHLSREGADLLAHRTLDLLGKEIPLG